MGRRLISLEVCSYPFRSLDRGSLGFGDFGGSGDAVGGAPERGDIDALHLRHRVEGALCPGAIGIADQPDKLAGNGKLCAIQSTSTELVTGQTHHPSGRGSPVATPGSCAVAPLRLMTSASRCGRCGVTSNLNPRNGQRNEPFPTG